MPLKRTPILLLILLLFSLSLTPLASQGASVSGFVFTDKGLDGLYRTGEDLVGGVEITLVQVADGREIPLASQTTVDGRYQFDGLGAGEYYLQLILPGGYVPTRYAEDGSQAVPSSTKGGRTVPFTLAAGENSTDRVIIGMMDSKHGAFVRAVAFGDDNLNGGRFSSEPLLRDVQLELLFEHQGVYYPVGTAATNKEGIGTISGVAPGTYVLGATMPGNYIVGPLGQKISLFYNGIVPGEGNYGRSEPFVLPAQGSVGMGVGGAVTGSAQGYAWADTNMDGRKGTGEPGAAGVTITLTHLSMGVERQVVTDASGLFTFPALQPGEYSLAASLPEGKMFTVGGGDSLLTSDTATTASRTVAVTAEQETQLGGIGVMDTTALSLVAFHDSDLNGFKDVDEPPFAGAKLQALKGGSVLGEATTDAQGIATIPLLRGQQMDLRVTLPDGQIFTISGGEEGNAFFAPTAESSLSIPYALAPGMHSQVLAGVTLPAQISGQLFEDSNSNALLDQGESPLPGFNVQALDENGLVVSEAQTDAQGRYLLPALLPGTYEVRIHLQSPFISSDAPTSTGEVVNQFTEQTADYGIARNVTVTAGGAQDKVDGAAFRSGVIRGQILLGDEHDAFAGAQGGLEGVLVELLDEDGVPVSQYTVDTTDAQGAFLVKGALPGTYSMRYTLPEDSAFSRPLSDDRAHVSAPFPVKAADEIQQAPLFAVKTGTFSGQVYIDGNVNGAFEDGDLALAGAQIAFVSDIPENSRTTVSQADGSYTVRNLRPGSYRMDISLPEGYLVSLDQSSPFSPAAGANNSADIAIAMGEVQQDRRIAAVPAHAVQGNAYFDNDLSKDLTAGEPGVPGLTLTWRHALTKVAFTADTDGQGNYAIPVLFPGAYTLSVTLPEDQEVYSVAIRNGDAYDVAVALDPLTASSAQDVGLVRFGSLRGQVWNMGGSMEHVDGLALTLLKEGSEVQKAVTDSTGRYQFDRLYPGEYMLRAVLAEGYRFARQVDSERTRFSLITSDGSGAAGSIGTSAPFALLMAEHKSAQDIGVGTTGRLGDYAWLDLDRDGMQDAGEPGVPGIQIRLYQYDLLAAETTTDAFGRYLFPELYPGTYTVEVTMPPELKATKQQTEFKLVASILPEVPGTVVRAEGVVVPSAARNLNADFGFVLVNEGVMPQSMQTLPQKDWTPLVPTVPKRTR